MLTGDHHAIYAHIGQLRAEPANNSSMQAGSQATQDLNQSKLKDRIVSGAVSTVSDRFRLHMLNTSRACLDEGFVQHASCDLQKESWSNKTSSEPGQGEGVIQDQAKSSAGGATGGDPAIEPTKADQMMTDPGQT